jgi:lysozyme family protein
VRAALKFLQALKTWNTFGKGWAKRVAHVQERGQCWAMGSVGPEPVFIPGGNVKATVDAAKRAPSGGLAGSAVGSGLATGSLAGAIQKAQDALAPYAGASETIQTVIAVLVASGVVLTAVGVAYSFWANKRKAELADALDTGAA